VLDFDGDDSPLERIPRVHPAILLPCCG